jgi:4-amino-4-deoxy-L-arabinose transferase-like glycosyltransferase
VKKKSRPQLWPSLALLILALTAGLYAFQLGSLPLTDRDEGEYAASVAEMHRTGDFLVPRLNGELYLEKPILVFWGVAAGQALVASGEAGARLPSAVSAFALVLLVGILAQAVSGSQSLAVLSAMSCAFMPLMLLMGRACLTDMLLTFFTTLALAAFFWASEKGPPAGKRWYLLAWAALGLGFLTKGPVAVAVVLPSALLYALLQGRLWQVLKNCQMHWGLLIFLGVNLPWYGLAFHRLGDQFWQAFFLSQNARRFSEVLLGHGGGYFYYLPVLIVGSFPLGAAALPAWSRALFRNGLAARKADALARLRFLAALTVTVTLAVFTLAATKQPNYILPAMPFIAVLSGYFLWRLASGEEVGRLARIFFWGHLWVLASLLTLLFLAIPWGLPLFWEAIQETIRPDSSEYALPLNAPSLWLWPLVCAAASVASVLIPRTLSRWRRTRLVPVGLGLAGACLGAALVLGLLGQVGDILQAPAKEMALAVKAKAGGQAEVLTFGLWKPSLFYYLDRQIPRLRTNEGERLEQALAQENPVLVLSRKTLEGGLAATPGFLSLAEYGGYLLGGNERGARLMEQTVSQTPAETPPPAAGRP